MRNVPIKSLKVAAAEIELDTDAKKDVQAAAADVADTLRSYSSRLDGLMANYVDNCGLRERIERFVNGVVLPAILDYPKDFRCTIYIEDPLLKGYLYQLVNYYPSGQGVGRRFSIRFGMIGRVWRTHKPFRVGTLLAADEGTTDRAAALNTIASRWGMSQEEAQHAMARPSYVAIPLDGGSRTIGLLFMDSTSNNAFEPKTVAVADATPIAANPGVQNVPHEDRLLPILTSGLSSCGIIEAITDIVDKLNSSDVRANLDFEKLAGA